MQIPCKDKEVMQHRLRHVPKRLQIELDRDQHIMTFHYEPRSRLEGADGLWADTFNYNWAQGADEMSLVYQPTDMEVEATFHADYKFFDHMRGIPGEFAVKVPSLLDEAED